MRLERPVSGLNLPLHFGLRAGTYDQDSECMHGGANDSLWDRASAGSRALGVRFLLRRLPAVSHKRRWPQSAFTGRSLAQDDGQQFGQLSR